jgi:hypothetical protein
MINKKYCRFCQQGMSTYQIFRCKKLGFEMLCPKCELSGRKPLELSIMDSEEEFSKKYKIWKDYLNE